MDRDPVKTAVREEARRRRLGADKACALCGEASLDVLREVTDPVLKKALRPRLLELHHVYGRAHDLRTTIFLCHNCHAKVTESLRRAGVSMAPQGNPLDRVIARRRAMAVFRHAEAAAEDRDSEVLETLRNFLDAKLPRWPEELKEWTKGT